MVGMLGYAGYSEKFTPGRISATVRDPGIDVSKIQALTDVTVTLDLANGKLISGRNRFVAGVFEVDSETSTFEIVLQGPYVDEITGSDGDAPAADDVR